MSTKKINRNNMAIPLLICSFLVSSSIVFADQSATDQASNTATQQPLNQYSLSDLQQTIKNKNYKDAYPLGLALRDTYEGDPEYDFLFGLAALETGVFHEAVFAFERVVTYSPNDLRARLELARAYYATNNYDAAEREFRFVLNNNPPENVKQNIRAFLTQINAHRNALKGKFTGFITVNTGYDSNINSATQANFIDGIIYNGISLGRITLDEGSKALESPFSKLGAGLNYALPLNKRSGLSTSITGDRVNNFNNDSYDTTSYSFEMKYHWLSDSTRWSTGVGYQDLSLNHEDYQNAVHLTAQASKPIGDQLNFSTTLTLSDIRYDNRKELDLYQGDIFLSLNTSLFTINHSIGLMYGNSDAKESTGKANGKEYYGFTYSALKTLSREQSLFARGLYQISENDGIHPLFQKVRKDNFFTLTTGWQWAARRDLILKTEISYSENNSNLELYEYDRSRLDIGLTYTM